MVPPAWQAGRAASSSTQFERLRGWLPEEVWERRDLFFFEGMQLEIGPCYRRYPAPTFFERRDARERGQGDRSTRRETSSATRGTGLPFAPTRIADDAPDAALRWAWNYRYRYQGVGLSRRLPHHRDDQGRARA